MNNKLTMATEINRSINKSTRVSSLEQISSAQYQDYGAANERETEQQRQQDRPNKVHLIMDHISIVVVLCIGTYIGVISRIYLSKLVQWDGVPHFGSLWAQIVGCIIMGLAVIYVENMNRYYWKRYLYIAVTTGLCGSLTTFSTWNKEATVTALHLNTSSLMMLESNDYATQIISYFTVIVLGFGMSLAAYTFGNNISMTVAQWFGTPSVGNISIHIGKTICWCVFLIIGYLLLTIILVFVCKYTDQYHILFSTLFGCAGTYIRWLLGKLDNITARLRQFPLGTFMANMIGSIVLAGISIVKVYVQLNIDVNNIVIDIITGITTGFCGSLTTVSTFVHQLHSLSFKIALFYGIVSLITSQVVFITSFILYSKLV